MVELNALKNRRIRAIRKKVSQSPHSPLIVFMSIYCLPIFAFQPRIFSMFSNAAMFSKHPWKFLEQANGSLFFKFNLKYWILRCLPYPQYFTPFSLFLSILFFLYLLLHSNRSIILWEIFHVLATTLIHIKHTFWVGYFFRMSIFCHSPIRL